MAHMSTTEVCPRCGGDKIVIIAKTVRDGLGETTHCPRCNGKGEIVVEKETGHYASQELQK
jgi:hypothetical protein